ncbi:MAG: hypothetical protein C4541_13055 [Candidatus Auribacter fodinae]|jgi:hypothetical protein|uniref:Uncharacterized protein n=1 Tax=Candidatus Auribacter fodinae TaxID=2093366 RepID=A0A3A4QZX7_9BACT|nr:MAG: hypothetical protein C4541_13055 [Candidatus Auribacter fodinae]
MKTKFFKEEMLGRKTREHFDILSSLSLDTTTKILGWLESLSKGPSITRKEVFYLSSITNESAENIMHALSAMIYCITIIAEGNDDIKDFYSDLKELKIINEKANYKSLDYFFSNLDSVVTKFQFFIRESHSANRGMPSLDRVSATAAMRPIYARDFSYDDDSLDTYKPNCIGLCVVAEIMLSTEDPDSFLSFQLNSEGLDRFISQLLAVQCQLKQMQEFAKTYNDKDRK